MTTPDNADGGFAALGLAPQLVEALASLGYEEPTPIQREAIPILLAGRDLLGQAATGTGKTAAFALPLLHHVGMALAGGDDDPRPRALVLVPTRELAIQVSEATHRYGKAFGICVVPVYGGQAVQQQLRALRRGAHVVVATPGRALDLIRRGSLALDAVKSVVLDEADEMLDMGFAEDLEAILDAVPKERQTALLSATLAPRIAALAERHLDDPVRVQIAREQLAAGEVPRVRQVVYMVQRQHKVAALGRVLDIENPTSAIVFCRTRNEVDVLSETLTARGYRAEALHGGLNQDQRDRVMRRFREGAAELLIATDVAARGLDIGHLSHVVNFDVPSAPEAYVHRIGRTGRAGREGVAITLAETREHRLLRNIEYVTKQKLRIEPIPTVLDLRARRLEITRASLRELLVDVEAGSLGDYRVVIEALADEFDLMDIALAAVKLAHAAQGPVDDESEIPAVTPPGARDGARKAPRSRDDRPQRGERFERSERPERGIRGEGPRAPREREVAKTGRDGWAERMERTEREERAPRGARPDRKAPRGRGAPRDADAVRLYVGLGRQAGVRPADLVGAIANEAGVDSRAIGAIEIADKFSIVEVPGGEAEDIIRALKGTTIRGKKPMVRRDRGRDG